MADIAEIQETTPATIPFDPAQLTPSENYKLLSGSVLPRPIAFVSTVDANGVRNLAPFSFFMAVCGNPPTLCFSVANRPPGNGLPPHKDTLANVRATGEFVVNIVSTDFAEKMNLTAAEVAPEVNEFALAGLHEVPSEVVAPPRVAEAKVQMECRLTQIIEASALPMGASLVLGQVVRFHVREDIVGDDKHVDPELLDAVGRLAGNSYCRTQDRFELIRPK